MRSPARTWILSILLAAAAARSAIAEDRVAPPTPLRLSWERNMLRIDGEQVPGRRIDVLYIEAYCRPNSHTTDWVEHTVIGHSTELVERSDDGTRLHLRCTLRDGVVVDHVITSSADEVDFAITAHNPTERPSEAHWAQPCVRVGDFTGLGDPENPATYAYLKRSFIFLDGELRRMPTRDWATEARYVPGQVWAGPGVPRADVNPRPLSPLTPSNGLIGCFSADEKRILAMAFDPWQELFQGVITCLHSDFRIGGLAPAETKRIRGKMWIVPADVPALVERYRKAFPKAGKTDGGDEDSRRARSEEPSRARDTSGDSQPEPRHEGPDEGRS